MMIDEYCTFKIFGYHSDDLSYGSNKRVVAVCDDCGLYRSLRMDQYSDMCRRCANKHRGHEVAMTQLAPKEISHNQVREMFDYQDGYLYWKVAKAYQIKIGDLAGYVKTDGYRSIQIDSKGYLVHRLIFLYHNGYLPKYLDHIDGDPANNDITNLREATNQENCRNAKKTKSYNGKPTTSIYKGVHWAKHAKKWHTQIMIDGKRKHLGYFKFEIEAALAYNTAAIKYYSEYAKLNEVK